MIEHIAVEIGKAHARAAGAHEAVQWLVEEGGGGMKLI